MRPKRAIKLFAGLIMRQPMGFVHLLEAVDFYHRGASEIVLVGDRDSAEFKEWRERIGLFTSPTGPSSPIDPGAPEPGFVPDPARDKTQVDGRLTAYVCRDFTCSAPQTTLAGLEENSNASPSRVRKNDLSAVYEDVDVPHPG